MKTNINFIISTSVLHIMRNISGKIIVKIKTHILLSIFFFFFESLAFYYNVEKYCRARQATDGKTTNAHCVLYT